MTNTSSEANRARLEIVREHVRRENAHDLSGIMATFGDRARYDDQPWDEHYVGPDAVAAHYADMLAALPDLHIRIEHQFAAEEGVILEVRIRGTHLGRWRGLPPTGRRVEFPLCAVFTLDEKGTLAENASTTIEAACCSKSDCIMIRRVRGDELKCSSRTRSRSLARLTVSS